MRTVRRFLHKRLSVLDVRLKYHRKGRDKLKKQMVDTRKLVLDLQIEIDIPVDIIQDDWRIKAVEDGLARSVSKGLYDQGVSFRISKVSSKIN